MFYFKVTFLIALAALLSACARSPLPDLKRLYESRPQPLAHEADVIPGMIQPPVILIHGAFGARLRDKTSKKEFWPGGLGSVLFHAYEDVALPIDAQMLLPGPSEIEAYAITDKAAGQDFYGAIIRTLENAGGYVPGVLGQPVADGRRRYYIFFYDWRQDNVQTARKLDALITQIREDYKMPDLRTDIVAHSMGGLVTRYFLRYGIEDTLDGNDFLVNNHGVSRVRKVILLGTPNLGSVSGLEEFMLGFKVGLRRMPTEVLATFPSSYQLFPHPIRTSLVLSDGRKLERDLFDVNVWRAFQWSIFDPTVSKRILKHFANRSKGEAYLDLLERYFEKHLERARRFVWSLSVPMENSPVRYIVFGGDCELTPARMLVEEVDGESVLRLYPNQVKHRLPGVDYKKLMLEPGDGRVTKPSLFARESLDPTVPRHKYSFFPLDHSILLCESHDSLTGNLSFQNNLLNILLTHEQSLNPMRMEK